MRYMGSAALDKVRSDALSLPEDERAELAYSPVASLDGPADDGVARAWEAEILRRLSEIDAGTAKLIDRGEFSRRLRERMKRG